MHITQKPLRLLRELIEVTPPGATILDPFMGSGTTGVAAILDGRRFVGVQASAEIARQAVARIAAAEDAPRPDGGAA